jgi:O-antigen ligase/tetratricopeptide (TPR) repeat protein
LTGGIVCIVGFFELWQWYGGTWNSPVGFREAGLNWSLGRSLRIKSVLHNPNALAYYLILLIGLAYYKLFQAPTIWQRGLWVSYLAMVATAALLTRSRGGLLGAFTTTVVAIILLWSRLGNKPAIPRVNPGQMLLAGALVTLTLFLAVLVLVMFFSPLLHTSWNAGLLSGRNHVWEGATRIFLAQPILGTGPGTFATNYMAYRDQTSSNTVYTHAHNIGLTLAAEYGIVGVLSVGYFFITLGRMILRYLRRTEASEWSWAILAGVSILAGQGIHNLVDDFMEFPIFTWFTILGVTLCLLPMKVQNQRRAKPKRLVRLLFAGGGTLIVAGGALWYGRAFAAYDRARFAAEANDWPQAVQWLENAVELDPTYQFYRQQLALAYGELARTDDHYLPLALAQQKHVYERDNSYPPDVAYLGCLYWQSRQPERAIELMRMAVSATPPRTGSYYSYHLSWLTFHFNLGHYLESMGEADLAQRAYAQTLLALPQLGTSPYWQVSYGRRQMLQASAGLARQLTAANHQAAEVAFHSGEYRTALELFATPPVDQIGQAKSLLAMGRVERAEKLLAEDSLQSTAESFAYRAQILMESGDLAQAEINIRKAIVLAPEKPSTLLEEPSYYYQWGHLAESQGHSSLAEGNYERAIAISTAIQTVYASLVWHRQPLPTEQPFCLMIPYPAENLSKPSLALADLLIAKDDPSASQIVYQDLLRHEPYNLEAQRRLDELLAGQPSLGPQDP